MVKCAACCCVMTDADGNEKEEKDVGHICKQCKGCLHSYVMCEAVWMPQNTHYFCSKACLRRSNKLVVDAALVENREENDSEEFGPGAPDWEDWLEENPDKWFPERQRPDREVVPPEVDQFDGFDMADMADMADMVTTPESVLLKALCREGSRYMESFRASEEDQSGEFYGGLMGPMINGKLYIGFDDGELTTRSMEEVRCLVEMNKACACTANGGLVAGTVQALAAASFCCITVEKQLLPIGVLLEATDDPSNSIYGVVYHSHYLSAEAVAAVVHNTPGRRRISRRAGARPAAAAGTLDLQGYKTLRRADKVGYIGGTEDEYCEEIVFGVLVFHDKVQQHRYIITYSKVFVKFSVCCWTSWTRTPLIAATEEFDAENSDAVASEPEEVAAMLAAWPASHLQALTTQAKLKKQASLGPAQLQEARAEAARVAERTRKANRKDRSIRRPSWRRPTA